MMVASGVRKSCEIAASSALRTACDCASSRARCSSRRISTRCSAWPIWSHRACAWARSSGSCATSVPWPRSTAAPRLTPRPRSGRYQSGSSAWRPVPGPIGSPWRRQCHRPAAWSASAVPTRITASSSLPSGRRSFTTSKATSTPASAASASRSGAACASGSAASRKVSPHWRSCSARRAWVCARRACARSPAISVETMLVTATIATSRRACSRRSTEKVWRGGTRAQLKASTASRPAAALTAPGSHSEASAEASTSSIAWLARSTRPSSAAIAAAAAAHTSMAGQASRRRQGDSASSPIRMATR